MPLLELHGYGVEVDGRRVLDNVNLTIETGRTFGIAGASGSGKSVLADAIGGLLPRHAQVGGAMRFDGSALPARESAMARVRGQRIGFIFGDGRIGLDPTQTLGLQLRRAMRVSELEKEKATAELLFEVGLDAHHAAALPRELDALETRRALLALALAATPQLVVADEPAGGLDVVAARKILDLLVTVQARRQFALLLCVRDFRAAALVCSDDVAVLDKGRIIENGGPEAVFARAQHLRTREIVAASKLKLPTLTRSPIGSDLLVAEELRFPMRDAPPADISFAVRRAETLAILGTTGAGKTRLARIVAGLDRATGGRLEFEHDGYRGSDLPRHRRREIGLLFSNPGQSFNPGLSVGNALTEPFRLEPQLLLEEQGQRLIDMVRTVGLEPEMLRHRPTAFTAVQLWRFAIARLLMARPRLVVLDDPARGLDLEQRDEIVGLLARVRSDYGLTMLLLTRDLEIARASADRMLVLERGRIVEEGKPYDLIDAPQHPATQAIIAARLPAVWTVTASGAVMGGG